MLIDRWVWMMPPKFVEKIVDFQNFHREGVLRKVVVVVLQEVVVAVLQAVVLQEVVVGVLHLQTVVVGLWVVVLQMVHQVLQVLVGGPRKVNHHILQQY